MGIVVVRVVLDRARLVHVTHALVVAMLAVEGVRSVVLLGFFGITV